MRLSLGNHPDGTARHAPGRALLVLAQVVVLVLFAALLARLWYLQIPMSEHYQQRALATHSEEVVVPATRGKIVDSSGRALVRNRTELVVMADYHALQRQEDEGEQVLRSVADLIGEPYRKVRQRSRLCGPDVSQPCWPGSPYQPIILAEDVEPREALQIRERQEDFPGVSARQHAIRDYPGGKNAAQTLGYLQPVTQEELEERDELRTRFSGVDRVGRGGLEATYDQQLRGTSGLERLTVDNHGRVTGTLNEEQPEPGKHLVTSIDRNVQEVTEKALSNGIEQSRSKGNPADSGAAVVLDVTNGRVVALASKPSYDPEVWKGGIDAEAYEKLLSDNAKDPLTSRAVQGQYPPASTFKVNSLAAAAENGVPLDRSFGCPSAITVGGRSFQNYAGSSHGTLSLHEAIVVSCNTVFYQIAHNMWRSDGGSNPDDNPTDAMTTMAHDFGFGKPTGVDLPHESSGRVPDREWKRERWEANREELCEHAEKGYPEVREEDPQQASYLKRVAKERCAAGYKWRAGDAVNFSIGQGDVSVTPLQLARAYAAIANGGALYEPRVGKALVSPDGEQTTRIDPEKAGELPLSDKTLEYLQDALNDVPKEGTAQGAFGDFPQGKVSISGKTGTATGRGKEESAWFASYAPSDDPQFAAVVMISQGGTGGANAAPVARQIYDGIYGFGSPDSSEDDEDDSSGGGEPALPDGEIPDELPDVEAGSPAATD